MKAQAPKNQRTDSQAAANNLKEEKESGVLNTSFVDNRPELVAQQKLQDMADNSPQVKVEKLEQKAPQGSSIVQKRGRGGHPALTYVVDITHPLANGGAPVQYYRDNVSGHGTQREVIAAAMQAFALAYPATVGQGAPNRNGAPTNGNAPAGAIAV